MAVSVLAQPGGSPRRRGCAGDHGAGQGEGFPLNGLSDRSHPMTPTWRGSDSQSAGNLEIRIRISAGRGVTLLDPFRGSAPVAHLAELRIANDPQFHRAGLQQIRLNSGQQMQAFLGDRRSRQAWLYDANIEFIAIVLPARLQLLEKRSIARAQSESSAPCRGAAFRASAYA